MRITDIILTAEQICGNSEGQALLLGTTEGFEYADGKKTDNHTHNKAESVFHMNRYEKATVKVMNTKQVITNEQIAQQGGSVKVKFKNLSGRFYRTASGEYELSCKADGMEVIA